MMNNKKSRAATLLKCAVGAGSFLVAITSTVLAVEKLDYEALSQRLTATEDRLRSVERELHSLKATPDGMRTAEDEGLRPSSRGRHYKGAYPLPKWPFYSTFFDHNNLVKCDLTIQTASRAFNDHGHTKDLSCVMFGSSSIELQDILLASKLVNKAEAILPGFLDTNPNLASFLDKGWIVDVNDVITDPESYRFTKTGYYLGILADQKFEFDSGQTDYTFALNYARNLHDGDVTLGINLPLVVRSHHIKLVSEIGKVNLETITTVEKGNAKPETDFTDKYPTLEKFLEAVLIEKGTTFNKDGTIAGIGDVSLYASAHARCKHVSRLMGGLTLQLPTGKNVDCKQLWQKPIGNGGFVELGLFGSVLFGEGKVFNPYINAQAVYVFSSRVNRRVPRVVSYDGVSPEPYSGFSSAAGYGTPMAGALFFKKDTPFSEPDATVRCFADSYTKVSMRKGPKFNLRLGNTFADIFSHKAFLDVYYDMHLQGRDHVNRCSGRDTSQIVRHTSSISHSLNLDYSYQHRSGIRTRLGTGYVFAGHNTPQTLSFEGAFNYDF